jgi:rhamnulokinase
MTVMATRNVAAVDLGAESGRVFLARFDGASVALEEVHRFRNRPVFIRGHRFWNLLGLWQEILAGLQRARQIAGQLDSVGVDSWAIDYGLVDDHGFLLGQPFCYRDHRTDGMMQRVCASIGPENIYARTGIQFLPFNTLYQLVAHEQMQPGKLSNAHRLLLIPDIFHAWLSGNFVTEQTNASTTQCWNPTTRSWATDLLDMVGVPAAIFPPVVEAGTDLGIVMREMQDELGTPRVIAPATHDTGSAIAGVPVAFSGDWGYVSSGTWSLVGVELPQPMISTAALAANCTNEGGIFGTTRFLKNVMGLWLLQECQRRWAREGYIADYDTLLAETDAITPFTALIDPDDPRFLAPDDMPAAINGYLVEHRQSALTTPPAFTRCIMESLVLRYAQVITEISNLTGKHLTGIHVVGGGSQNARMNQWLADVLDIPVLAGPGEATALGNALMQLVGLGELRTLADVRHLAYATPTTAFLPRPMHQAQWREAGARFAALIG